MCAVWNTEQRALVKQKPHFDFLLSSENFGADAVKILNHSMMKTWIRSITLHRCCWPLHCALNSNLKVCASKDCNISICLSFFSRRRHWLLLANLAIAVNWIELSQSIRQNWESWQYDKLERGKEGRSEESRASLSIAPTYCQTMFIHWRKRLSEGESGSRERALLNLGPISTSIVIPCHSLHAQSNCYLLYSKINEK